MVTKCNQWSDTFGPELKLIFNRGYANNGSLTECSISQYWSLMDTLGTMPFWLESPVASKQNVYLFKCCCCCNAAVSKSSITKWKVNTTQLCCYSCNAAMLSGIIVWMVATCFFISCAMKQKCWSISVHCVCVTVTITVTPLKLLLSYRPLAWSIVIDLNCQA